MVPKDIHQAEAGSCAESSEPASLSQILRRLSPEAKATAHLVQPLQGIVVELCSQHQAMRKIAVPHEQQCAGLQQPLHIGHCQHVTVLSCLRASQIRKDVVEHRTLE